MSIYTEILLGILLVALSLAAFKVYFVLGDVQKMLTKVDETRAEVTDVVKQVEEVVTSANRLLKEEVTPTLQVARETLANVEITTRALADTTTAARRVALRADALVSSPQLLALGSTVGQFLVKKAGNTAMSALKGVGGGLMSLLGRRKQESPLSTQSAEAPKALSKKHPTASLPASETAIVKALVCADEKTKVRKAGR